MRGLLLQTAVSIEIMLHNDMLLKLCVTNIMHITLNHVDLTRTDLQHAISSGVSEGGGGYAGGYRPPLNFKVNFIFNTMLQA